MIGPKKLRGRPPNQRFTHRMAVAEVLTAEQVTKLQSLLLTIAIVRDLPRTQQKMFLEDLIFRLPYYNINKQMRMISPA